MPILPAGPLSYGMQLPIQSQSAIYAEPWEAGATPADLAEIARTADRTGFAYLASCDHVAIPRRLAEGMSTVWYDPVATLGFLAGVTERVLLMSHVAVVGLRHPLATAKQYATLDHLSGGRLILGVGAGHVREEFEALGADFDGRGGVLDETVDALKVALGPEEYPEFAGERFSFSGLGQLPRPAQERVPIWVGGSSPAAVRRAAVRGTAGCRRVIRAGSCRSRSPGCTRCARPPGWRSRSSSEPSRNRCTWASRTGPWGGAPSAGSRRPSRSPCGSTRRWACTRYRCGSAAAAEPN